MDSTNANIFSRYYAHLEKTLNISTANDSIFTVSAVHQDDTTPEQERCDPVSQSVVSCQLWFVVLLHWKRRPPGGIILTGLYPSWQDKRHSTDWPLDEQASSVWGGRMEKGGQESCSGTEISSYTSTIDWVNSKADESNEPQGIFHPGKKS